MYLLKFWFRIVFNQKKLWTAALNKTKICECPQPLLSAAFLKENVFFEMLVYQKKKKRFMKGHGEGVLKMVIICIRNVTRTLFRSLSHRNANIIYLRLSQCFFCFFCS